MGMTWLWTKDDQGHTAPNQAKMAMLRSMSMEGWRESSLVSRRNQSLQKLVSTGLPPVSCRLDTRRTHSQVKALPAMKQASTSSLPIIPHVPTMKS